MDVDNREFLDFVERADAHNLDYILIGGLALILNGGVRMTQDVDIWLKPTNENRDRFVATLRAFGYDDEDIADMRVADFTQPQIIRIHDVPLDVLTQVHSKFDYEQCRARAKPFETSRGPRVYFLHINDLRELKILARRPKDLTDVLMIDELLNEATQIKPNNLE
ncbi:DUF6036 family nucleotidyltransferase [Fibrella aquatilis]|uniref:DUF6036 domain-containing protein n=1 Tax=Fibrella aquatilis TaxID=2817059 RepID=A0A939G4R4_9BACT|nr:DUF6036 family nucleotidyltransferase [Fibrella aquatilis]MBO0931183.1 hypothetical protein [Fibrella aquatilis]